MAENVCQNVKKKKNNNRQTVSFPYLSFRPISLAAPTDLFQYHSDWIFFFLVTHEKGNGIIRQAVLGSAVVTCSMRPPLQMRAADVTYVRRKAWCKKENLKGKSS